MPNVNIYIPEKYVQPITERLKEGESLGVCAKRLLLNFLDGRDIDSNKQGAELDSSDLEAIKERLSSLEGNLDYNRLATCFNFLSERLDLFEERFSELEKLKLVLGKADKILEILKIQEERLTALEETLRRSRSKRDSNGRFIKKGEKDG